MARTILIEIKLGKYIRSRILFIGPSPSLVLHILARIRRVKPTQ